MKKNEVSLLVDLLAKLYDDVPRRDWKTRGKVKCILNYLFSRNQLDLYERS